MTANTKRTIETACIGTCSVPEYISFLCTDILPCSAGGALTVDAGTPAEGTGILSIGNITPDGGYSSEAAHTFFTDEAAQSALFDSLLPVLQLQNRKGVNFCFQYIYPFDREACTRFFQRASELLHRRGYLVFASLPLRAEGTLYHSAHDSECIARCADRVLLISRGQGRRYSPPGPEPSPAELRQAISRASGLIPTGKILLDISVPACRWVLPWHMGETGELMTNERAVLTARAVGAQIRRDRMTNMPFFTYTDPAGRSCAVWYDDSESLSARLCLVNEFSLAGICASGMLCDAVMTGEITKRFKIEK